MPKDTRSEYVAGSLYMRTRQLLLNDHKTLEEIARGSGISIYWLQKFKAGSIGSPNVNRTQQLYEYLSGKALSC